MTIAALPPGWTTRRPTLDDVPAILELVHASDVAAVGEPDFTADEVREALTEPNTDMTRDCWLALDPDARIVAWAYANNPTGGDREFVEVYVWPQRGLPALRPLLGLLMERVAERAVGFGHDPYHVRAGAIPTETPYIEALTEVGFAFLKQHARMQMSLAGVASTPPQPPSGVTIRAVRADDEAEMRCFHAVIEQAFRDSDHRSIDYERWRRQIAGEPTLAYDEWFVAEIDGQVVGALQSSDSGADHRSRRPCCLSALRACPAAGYGRNQAPPPPEEQVTGWCGCELRRRVLE